MEVGGIRRGHQLAFRHLGIGFGKLEPQRLGVLRVEADALQERKRRWLITKVKCKNCNTLPSKTVTAEFMRMFKI